jgi:hypothetical protein
MKLLNESFQRKLIIQNFKKWIISNICAFVPVSKIVLSPSTTQEVEDQEVQDETIEDNCNDSSNIDITSE